MTCVLVVDDERAIVDLLSAALTMEGYDVITAVGAEAIVLAQVYRPALILLDINMPGMDGLEVAFHPRQDALTRKIPIVLMSAADRLRERARDAPVTALLPKPFELDGLLDCVHELAGEPTEA